MHVHESRRRKSTSDRNGKLRVTLRASAARGHLADEGEEGEVHGYDDGADGDAEEADHDGLDERQEARDGGVYFLLVEVRYLAEHRVERARLLAYADHLRDHVGEDLARLQGLDDRLAALDPDADLVDGVLDHGVAGRARRYLQRLKDGHARGEQRGERAGESRDRDLAKYLPDDGNLERDLVHMPAALRRLVVGAGAHGRADDRAEQDEAAYPGEEVAYPDDDARRERELLAGAEQAGEDVLERRDDEDHDDRDDRDGDDDDRGRVYQRRDHVAAQLDDLLDVGREAL